MKRTFAQIAFFIVSAAILAVGRNTLAPGKIPWVGEWSKPAVSEGDSMPRPKSSQANDPPFLTFEEAKAMYGSPDVIFVDARYPEDYTAGHINGAMLLPFEMFDDYWPAVEQKMPKDKEIVTYCGGEDCELSLFLARWLRDKYGYKDVYIFFGGAVKWKEHNMPVDTSPAPPPGV